MMPLSIRNAPVNGLNLVMWKRVDRGYCCLSVLFCLLTRNINSDLGGWMQRLALNVKHVFAFTFSM